MKQWIYTDYHLEYCNTPQQTEIVKRRVRGESWMAIARALGVDKANCQHNAHIVYRRAAKQGYDPANHLDEPLTPGQSLQGVTTLYKFNEHGQKVPAMQYVLGRQDKENNQALLDGINLAIENIQPIKPIKSPKRCNSNLLTMYHYTDYHLAMYAHAAETGDNWDNKIASRVFAQSLDELIAGSPDSEVGVFSQGGDWCHYDSLLPVTPTSKHVLDADSRIHVMVELALDMHIHAIERLLKKHKRVLAVIQEGNHDEASSVWLRKAMVRYFAKNKRVEILDVDFPYYAYLHGEIMIGWHHGHKMANKQLPALFAAEPRYREMWGKAKYSYIHTGHFHKKDQQADEFDGAVVERHPTLAGRDAYAARSGYVSWRAVNAITYHKTDGEVGRVTTVPRHG